jgi:hypothetical protein
MQGRAAAAELGVTGSRVVNELRELKAGQRCFGPIGQRNAERTNPGKPAGPSRPALGQGRLAGNAGA